MKGNRVISFSVVILFCFSIIFLSGSNIEGSSNKGKRVKRYLDKLVVQTPDMFTRMEYFYKNLDPNTERIYIYYAQFSTFFIPFDQFNNRMIVRNLQFVPSHHFDTNWPTSTHPSWNTWHKQNGNAFKGRHFVDNKNKRSYSTVDIILYHPGWVPVVGMRSIAKITAPANLNIGPWYMQCDWYDNLWDDTWSSPNANGIAFLSEKDPRAPSPPQQTAGSANNESTPTSVLDLLDMAGINFEIFEEEDGERMSYVYDPFESSEPLPLQSNISGSSSVTEPAMVRFDDEAEFPDTLLYALKNRYVQCKLFFDPNTVSWEMCNLEGEWKELDPDDGIYYTPTPLFLVDGDGSNCGQKKVSDPNHLRDTAKYRCSVTLRFKQEVDVFSLMGKKFPMEVMSLRGKDILLGEEMSYIMLKDSGFESNIDPNGMEERVQILTFKSGPMVPVDWRAPYYEDFTRGNFFDEETGEKVVYMSELVDGGFLNFNIPQEILFFMARDWLKEDGYNVLMDLRTDGVIDMLDLGKYFVSGCNPFLFRRPEMFSELVSMF